MTEKCKMTVSGRRHVDYRGARNTNWHRKYWCKSELKALEALIKNSIVAERKRRKTVDWQQQLDIGWPRKFSLWSIVIFPYGKRIRREKSRCTIVVEEIQQLWRRKVWTQRSLWEKIDFSVHTKLFGTICAEHFPFRD